MMTIILKILGFLAKGLVSSASKLPSFVLNLFKIEKHYHNHYYRGGAYDEKLING